MKNFVYAALLAVGLAGTVYGQKPATLYKTVPLNTAVKVQGNNASTLDELGFERQKGEADATPKFKISNSTLEKLKQLMNDKKGLEVAADGTISVK